MREKIYFGPSIDDNTFEFLNELAARLSNDKVKISIEDTPQGVSVFKEDIEVDEMMAYYDRWERAYDQWQDQKRDEQE